MKDLLVIGRSGLLARALAARGAQTAGRKEVDIFNADSVAALIAAVRPSAVINAAAYTAVDKAEDEAEAAFALNRDAVAVLAAASAHAQIPFVHVSTDYVFNGEKSGAYTESDEKQPLGVYGRSKSEGEEAALNSGARAAVLRTSWVYAADGGNFVRTMLRLAQDRDEVRVVADQFGKPTHANDLADACIAMAALLAAKNVNAEGVFHYAGAGETSWAGFAEAIFAEAAMRGMPSARVVSITTGEYPTRARRPANSRLDTSKIESLGVPTRPWREALKLCFDAMPL
ncbi:MAG: dTDP-4-dehydrorhamnose reductase [Caulobacterales bacterium]